MRYKIEVCLSPELYPKFARQDTIVVVVDVLRATTCMVTAIANGVPKMIPIKDLETCRSYQAQGYIIAGERNGQIVEGFDIGNSPFHYTDHALKGKPVAISTTNGTVAIEAAKDAKQVLIGAFVNLKAIVEYLQGQDQDVIILCAGWKGHVNIEDTLFAGALTTGLERSHLLDHDATLISKEIYKIHKDNMFAFISQCAHVQRLARLGIEKDILYALTPDQFNVVPYLKDGEIIG